MQRDQSRCVRLGKHASHPGGAIIAGLRDCKVCPVSDLHVRHTSRNTAKSLGLRMSSRMEKTGQGRLAHPRPGSGRLSFTAAIARCGS
eukprot:scaffold11114_cov41-Prasinocladus_malaysianus.AAC.1